MLRRDRRRGRSAEEVCLPSIRLRPARHRLAFPSWSGTNVALRILRLYLIRGCYGGW